MKKKYIFLILVISLVLLGVFIKSEDNNDNFEKKVAVVDNLNYINNSIDSQEFKNKMETGKYIILDIRSFNYYEKGRIGENTINISFFDDGFLDKLKKLDKNKKYLYYCGSGMKSLEAKEIFKELGFRETYELNGGERE